MPGGRYCCVPWCGNSSGKVKGQCVTFFSFPKDESLKLKWIDFVAGGSDWIPSQSSKVCSDHFSSDMVKVSNTRLVKKTDAYPGKT